MSRTFVTFFLFLYTLLSYAQQAGSFIETRGNQFMLRGAPYYYMGANVWYGMHLGAEALPGDRARLVRELDKLHSLGVTNLRIMGSSEGPDHLPYRVVPAL